MRALGRVLAPVVAHGVEGLCVVLLAAISVDLLLGVFSRYVMGRTFVWYDEVARACFIWLVFLGAAVAVKRGAHFGLHVLVDAMPPHLRRAALLLTPLTVIVFAAVLVVQGWSLTRHGATQTTAVMAMPVSWIYAAMPVGGTLMILYSLPVAWRVWRGAAMSEDEPGKRQ
ncbi:MAG TPA: TRAP transporter small permease [Burkholderiales bacterium]|nr:TRAP transporter small permease [Burkholderiales bacterium]